MTQEVAVALQGTLDTFALADVLRLLAATTKSGRLRIDGDRGIGSVWLTDGSVVAGTVELCGPDGIVPCTEPSDVVFELLRHTEGTFEFLADESTEDSRPPMAVDEVVSAAEQKLSDWRAVEGVVPSLDHAVTLAPEVEEEVVIGREGWRTLLAIGEGRSVGQVGERLGVGEIAVSTAVKALVDERLAVIGEAVVVPTAEPEPVDEAQPVPTLEDVVADLGASPELDVVVQAELAPGEVPGGVPGEVLVDPASLGGSHAVDLDTALDSDETGHSYLAEDSAAGVALPEPLTAELTATEPAPEPAADVQVQTDDAMAEQDGLAQMSPRAAEAIAAAEAGESTDEQSEAPPSTEEESTGEQPMNRNLLMKFISSK